MTGLPIVPPRATPMHEEDEEAEDGEAPPVMPPRPGQTHSPSPPPPYMPSVPPRRGATPSSGTSTPRPPPRLPSRQPSQPDIHERGNNNNDNTGGAIPLPAPSMPARQPSPAARNDGYINTQAAGRLAKAGVSVPGLDIGGSGAEEGGAASVSAARPVGGVPAGQMNELQARFARMGKSNGNGDGGEETQQSATVNPAAGGVVTAAANANASAVAAAALKKPKPKPPPPKKKPGLSSAPAASVVGAEAGAGAQDAAQGGGEYGAPPPIPHASKPR